MGRSPCCDKLGLKKGPWTPEEDQKLLAYIEEHGHGNWRALPTKAGLQRCGKSCRLRWTNYLRPDIKRGKFSLQEEQTIIQLHALLGNRWSAIATHLPKRTDNEIKNYWNTHLKKRLAKMGIDPVTHKPKNDALLPAAEGGGQQSKNAANLSHIAQWESARLEAEARLARQSKLRGTSSTSNSNNNNSSFLSPMSPDIHINDHHQIVPSVSTMGPLSSSTSSSAAAHHQYLSMTATAATTATTTTPRCLDVLKAWHNVWPNNDTNTNTSTTTNNNSNSDHFICIGMGSSSGIGGGIGVGIESPTSTLSFSENAPAAVSTMGTGAGAVIEFMGHNNSDHHHHHHSHHQDMVKNEDHHHQWKRSGGGDGFDNGIEMNSLSFHDMNTLSIHQSHDHDNDHDNDNNNDDQDDHNDHGEGFIEGFTELLLSTNNNNISDTTTTKTTTNICGSKSPTKQGEENNNNNNNNDNSSGSTTRSGGSDYYEDNKTYWNSILNLVNSSPPNSPMF